jgi:hypothetical protein
MSRLVKILLICALLPAGVSAQGDRARDWDAGFHVNGNSSLSTSGFGGASMQVESDVGWGFSGAYNFTDRFALGLDASWRRPNYRADFVPQAGGPVRVINTRMDVSRIQFKGIFYFLESSLTPFVEVGFGWARIDSNILERPPIVGCWWDPWWGLICDSFFTTFTETRPTYGAAVGVRWDSRGDIAVRGSIGALNIDRARGVDNSNVSVAQVELLWRF